MSGWTVDASPVLGRPFSRRDIRWRQMLGVELMIQAGGIRYDEFGHGRSCWRVGAPLRLRTGAAIERLWGSMTSHPASNLQPLPDNFGEGCW